MLNHSSRPLRFVSFALGACLYGCTQTVPDAVVDSDEALAEPAAADDEEALAELATVNRDEVRAEVDACAAEPPPAPLERVDRAAVVVQHLGGAEPAWLRPVYAFIDAQGLALFRRSAAGSYDVTEELVGEGATAPAAATAIARLSRDHRAVDVFLNIHGSPGTMHFADGLITSRDFAKSLRDAGVQGGSLRALYTTACYGASWSGAFTDVGFTAFAGARAINTNAAIEYPQFLDRWAGGATFAESLALSPAQVLAGEFGDVAACTVLSRTDCDSAKVVSDRQNTRLTSVPAPPAPIAPPPAVCIGLSRTECLAKADCVWVDFDVNNPEAATGCFTAGESSEVQACDEEWT